MIRAGELTERIELFQPTETDDNMGQAVESFASLRKVWARQMQASGKEFVLGGGVAHQSRVAFKIRFASDIAALGTTLRVAWAGTSFEVIDRTMKRGEGEIWLHCQSIAKVPA